MNLLFAVFPSPKIFRNRSRPIDNILVQFIRPRRKHVPANIDGVLGTFLIGDEFVEHFERGAG